MIDEAAVLTLQFKDAGDIPNHPVLPLLIYQQAVKLEGRDPAAVFEMLFPRGGWHPAWRWGVYPFPHYHSTAHEVLGVFRGTARLLLGHTTGLTCDVQPGDVIVIPAGVGHQNLEASADFQVVGGYPDGQEADLLRGDPGERPAADRNIAGLSLPAGDPVFGPNGPLRKHWKLKGSWS